MSGNRNECINGVSIGAATRLLILESSLDLSSWSRSLHKSSGASEQSGSTGKNHHLVNLADASRGSSIARHRA